jgi:serine/threonine protein kinase
VVLTDFGFAKQVVPNRRNAATCGTLAYIAPEVINPSPLGYSYPVDWWSLGVVLFTMITGFFPFLRQKPQETARAICRDPLRFPTKPAVTPEAQDLCRRLLEKKTSNRIASIDQLKAHPWYAGFDWDAAQHGRLPPPFVPEVDGPNTKYFSEKLTTQDVTSSTFDEEFSSPESRKQNVFSSFYFSDEEMGSDGSPDDPVTPLVVPKVKATHF